MTKVLILGATGMLGSAVVNEFSNSHFQVVATVRSKSKTLDVEDLIVREFDAEIHDIANVAGDFGPDDFIINCIGLVKARIDESNPDSVRRAIQLNALLPHQIQNLVSSSGSKVIQIATDCVYSGSKGSYLETDPHDALDVYGKTKSLGEVRSSNYMNIRTSIIGPEFSGHTSLYDWVRMQPQGAELNGFSNHYWNGIPALHFAKASKAIIDAGLFSAGIHHFVPADSITKFDLVNSIAKKLDRDDLRIKAFDHETAIDRTLATKNLEFSRTLWKLLNFPVVPKISELISQIS